MPEPAQPSWLDDEEWVNDDLVKFLEVAKAPKLIQVLDPTKAVDEASCLDEQTF